MKAVLISLSVVMAMVATGAALVEPQSSVASHLAHKQVHHLLNAAGTPEDHRELAHYFRKEAQKNRDKEQRYLETAATYRLHPPRVDMYRNASTSNLYRHSADEARQLALADEG